MTSAGRLVMARALAATLVLTGLAACESEEEGLGPPGGAAATTAGPAGGTGSGGSGGAGGAEGSGGGEQGGAGGGTGGGGGVGVGGGTPAELDCETYCATVMQNCTGDHAVYASNDICLGVCGKLPVGASTDTTGNTLGCRTYHAGAAEMDPATHCPHAGPGGAGFCGENCESYCTLVLATCADEFASEDECLDACAKYPTQEPFDVYDTTGDTIQCRLYHVSVATTDASHCAHVGVAPAAGTCTD